MSLLTEIRDDARNNNRIMVLFSIIMAGFTMMMLGFTLSGIFVTIKSYIVPTQDFLFAEFWMISGELIVLSVLLILILKRFYPEKRSLTPWKK
jgi:membrane protein implicated in regulation of membrane protease activity